MNRNVFPQFGRIGVLFACAEAGSRRSMWFSANRSASPSGLAVRGARLESLLHQQITMLDQEFTQKDKSLGRPISPFSYMKGGDSIDFGLKATTFGRRNDKNEWKFYSHVYRIQGQNYLHCGVKSYVHHIST